MTEPLSRVHLSCMHSSPFIPIHRLYIILISSRLLHGSIIQQIMHNMYHRQIIITSPTSSHPLHQRGRHCVQVNLKCAVSTLHQLGVMLPPREALPGWIISTTDYNTHSALEVPAAVHTSCISIVCGYNHNTTLLSVLLGMLVHLCDDHRIR